MKKPKFSLAHRDDALAILVEKSLHKTLAVWAIACTEKVLPYFQAQYPDDLRPQQALETLQAWIEIGEFHMSVIRGVSLAAHAAAREAEPGSPAQSAARAAGQAVATAHVPAHALGAALYAQQAVHRAASNESAASVVTSERDWQYQLLLELNEEGDLSDQ
jgi:hypothetical protein